MTRILITAILFFVCYISIYGQVNQVVTKFPGGTSGQSIIGVLSY